MEIPWVNKDDFVAYFFKILSGCTDMCDFYVFGPIKKQKRTNWIPFFLETKKRRPNSIELKIPQKRKHENKADLWVHARLSPIFSWKGDDKCISSIFDGQCSWGTRTEFKVVYHALGRFALRKVTEQSSIHT